MSAEHHVNLSAEQIASAREFVKKLTGLIREAIAANDRDGLELLKATYGGMGGSEDALDARIKEEEDRLKREAAIIDGELEVANILTRLELLFSLAMRDGDYKTALQVVQERAKFTGAAQHVRFSSRERRQPPSEFEKAMEDIGPVERERLRMEMEEKLYAAAKQKRENVAAKTKLGADNENQPRQP